jgi:transposase
MERRSGQQDLKQIPRRPASRVGKWKKRSCTEMEHYAGLDVSLWATAVCVIDERGRVVIERKIPSEPDAIADFLLPYAATLKLAGLEAGLLAPYLYNGLVEHGVPTVCIETRRMKAFAKASPVKTDRKDAHLIALAPHDRWSG